MQAVAAGDRTSLEALYDRHSPLVLALCQRVFKDTGVAEDVLVDLFFEVWTKADRFDAARGSPLTYLLTLARSRAIDRERSRIPRPKITSDFTDVAASSDPVATAPPPYLKSRLMQRIAALEPAKPAANLAAEEHGGDSPAMRLFRYFVPAAVAAGLAVIVTHFVVTHRSSVYQLQAESLQSQRDILAMQVLSQQQQLDLLQAEKQSQTKVVDLLRSPNVELFPLKPTALQPRAVANLLWDKSNHQWAILTDGMAQAAPGQTYELWFVPKTGAPVAAGTFNVDATGRGSLRVNVPPDIGPLKLAAVTNEAAGGSPQPKGKFQVVGSVE